MKRYLLYCVLWLFLLVAGSAQAVIVNGEILSGNSGYRWDVTSSVTTSDFLRAPARSFQRLAFTKTTSLEVEVFACHTDTYVAAACTSMGALTASTNSLAISTGRPWIIIDVTAAETSGTSYITIQSNPQNAGAGGGGGSGQEVYFAEDYTHPATFGIEAAINAACAAGGGVVVMPSGTLATTAVINIDCNFVELIGSYYGTTLVPTTGTTGILVTGDWVSMRDFRIDFAGSNAANIGIDMDNNASTVSRWSISFVRMIGQSNTGSGIRCELCQKGSIRESQISDFQYGFYGTSTPNNNLSSSDTFNSNDYGIYIADTMSSTLNVHSTAFESNVNDGVYCASAGAGIVVSVGSHYEANANGLHRPASGCGFVSLGDTNSSNTGDDFLKESSGAVDDFLMGTYFSAAGIGNTGSELIPVLFPTNTSLNIPMDGLDAVLFDELSITPAVGLANSSSVTNTTTETAFSICDDFAITANQLLAGAVIHVSAGGYMSTAAAPGTLAFRIRSTTSNTGPLIVDLGTTTALRGSASNAPWRVEADLVWRTIGASAAATGTGTATTPTSGVPEVVLDAVQGTIATDTTATITPTLFVDWGTADAANTILADVCNISIVRH